MLYCYCSSIESEFYTLLKLILGTSEQHFLYLCFRSLDVLGTNANETQLYSEDRRKSSFSPRRTSGASSVSGAYINKSDGEIKNEQIIQTSNKN